MFWSRRPGRYFEFRDLLSLLPRRSRHTLGFVLPTVEAEGEQTLPARNVPLWDAEYFRLANFKEQQACLREVLKTTWPLPIVKGADVSKARVPSWVRP